MRDTGGGNPGFKGMGENTVPLLPARDLWQISHCSSQHSGWQLYEAVAISVRVMAAAGHGFEFQGLAGWWPSIP